MPKTRVYELAKELGLENKAVLDLCEQLGIDDKHSHSNSLSEEESERIRRFVIRRAVSDRDGLVRELNRDGEIMTERRIGSVIRRRKKIEDEEEAVEEDDGKRIDFADIPRGEAGIQHLVPNLQAEKRDRDEALRRADELFGEAAAEAAAEAEAKADVEFDEASSAKVESQEAASEEEAGEVSEDIGEPEVEEGEGALSVESGREEIGESGYDREEALAELRRRHDIRAPKVLGKIDLPVELDPKPGTEEKGKAKSATEESSTEAGAGRVRGRGAKKRKSGESASEDVDDNDRPRRKPRKRQVLRKDQLLDYDGDRDGWKTRRDKKSKRGRDDARDGSLGEIASARPSKLVVKIAGEISVNELAKSMGSKVSEVMTQLMNLGVMATINQLVDFDTATLVASELGFTTVNTVTDEDAFVEALNQPVDDEALEIRPPVVTVMGHVDHGKTSLLDVIRTSSVADGEVGGITQHIGAYNVVLPSGGSVTFLDTPGHEAFTAMRSRGAQITDIVVLVTAADDGVMPQTVEAIDHAKAAGVPIIVAINKIDKEDANIDRVINQLSEHELIPEDWGGDTIVVRVSAHTKEGVDLLLENLHLQAEVLELKANPRRPALGTVVESRLDRGRGPVMTVLVKNGTLKKGDFFFAGAVFGRVRALVADDGSTIDEAGPSIPVEVLGASAAAISGDDFYVLEDEAQARKMADLRAAKRRTKELAASAGTAGIGQALTLENFSEMIRSGETTDLPLVVKADVQGAVQALTSSLERLSNEEITVKVISKGVGAITENDVQLASASKALLVGFNVRPDARAGALLSSEGVEILYSRVIYDIVDMVESVLKGRMAPKFQEKTLGRVEVRDTFRVPKLGVVAGSYVLDGTILRGAKVRLVRDSVVVYEGKMASLRRFKDDVKEVAAGYECGIGIEGYSDIQLGDVIECYTMEEVQ